MNEEVALVGSSFAEANLARLIDLMSDRDVANRDWATFLLAQLELDRPDVRHALIQAAEDREGIVRAEAILGLAQLDPAIALPLIRRELAAEILYYPVLEAAEIAPHPSLLEPLAASLDPADDGHFYEQTICALESCKRAS